MRYVGEKENTADLFSLTCASDSSKKSDVVASKAQSKKRDQVISSRDINPDKLVDTLDGKFGKGNYQGEVRS